MSPFLQNRHVRNVLSMAGGAAVAQLLFVISTPILTRLYLPANYGFFANLMALSAIYAPVASFRYDFLYFKSKDEKKHYFSACLIAMSLTLPLFFIVFSHYYNDDVSGHLNMLILLVICSSGLLNLTSQFLIGGLKYSSFSRTKAIQGVVQVVLSLLLGFAGYPGGLVWALLCAQMIAVGLQYKELILDKKIALSVRGGLVTLAQQYKLAMTSTCITLLQYSTPLAPIFISMHYFNKEQSGSYFFCAQLFSLPLSLFRRAFLNIITSEFYDINMAKYNFTQLYIKTKRYYPFVVLAICLVMTIMILFGQQIFKVVFGKQWSEAGNIAWVVLLMFIVDMFCQPISNMLTLWNSEFKNLLIEFVRFNGVFTLPIYLLQFYKMTFSQYVYLHCLVMVIVYFLSSFVTLRKMALHVAA